MEHEAKRAAGDGDERTAGPSRVFTASCKVPPTVWPSLIHAGQQSLLEDLTIEGDPSRPAPQVAVRVALMIPEPWPIELAAAGPGRYRPCRVVAPPLSLDPRALHRDPFTGAVEVLVDGARAAVHEVTVMPPTAIPTSPDAMLALAAFVLPGAREVVEMVRRAAPRAGATASLGFTMLTPVEAARALYADLVDQCRAGRLSYAWEPGPWRAASAAQSVRLPSRIDADREGTCIDVALLLAASIEHVRRLPVIVGACDGGPSWHVVAGVRADDDDVGPAFIRDAAEIIASIVEGRVIPFDPEGIHRGLGADDAVSLARDRIERATDLFLVDVQGARERGIWPLPVEDAPRAAPWIGYARPNRLERPAGIPEDLFEEIASGRCVVLVGDSLDPEVAVTREGLKNAVLDAASTDENDFYFACQRFVARFGTPGRAELERLVQRTLHTAREPSEVYRDLAALPVQTVVSLHPDPALEAALTAAHPPFRPVIPGLRDRPHAPSTRALFLLGGSGISCEGLVLSELEHGKRSSQLRYLDELTVPIAMGSLLLLGCDLADGYMQHLYARATGGISQRAFPVFGSGVTGAYDDFWAHKPLVLLDRPPAALLRAVASALPARPRTAPSVAPAAWARERREPYKFLDYFDAEDADIFFGRAQECEAALTVVRAAPGRVAIICGLSGVGKTSLVKAFLCPELERGGRAVVMYVRCGNDPEASICRALASRIAPRSEGEPAPTALHDVLGGFRELHPAREVVVVLDQAEELFFRLSPAALDDFFRGVGASTADPELSFRFVFVVRQDFLARLAHHARWIHDGMAGVYVLPELSREAARDAFVKPAERLGLPVEPALVDAVLDDLDEMSSSTVLPAHLQVVCYRLYEARAASTGLTLELYQSLGRTKRILERHLEQAMDRLPADDLELARAVMRALVTSKDTRDVLTLEEAAARARRPVASVSRVVHELVHTHRLVREVPGDVARYELSHDTLAAGVVTWLDAAERVIRSVQEMVHQEMSTLLRNPHFRIPPDKLRLFDRHLPALDLEPRTVIALSLEQARTDSLSGAWVERIVALDPAFVHRELFSELHRAHLAPAPRGRRPGLVGIRCLGALAKMLRTLPTSFLEAIRRGPLPPGLVAAIEFGLPSIDLLPKLLALAIADPTRAGLLALLRSVEGSPERERALTDAWARRGADGLDAAAALLLHVRTREEPGRADTSQATDLAAHLLGSFAATEEHAISSRVHTLASLVPRELAYQKLLWEPLACRSEPEFADLTAARAKWMHDVLGPIPFPSGLSEAAAQVARQSTYRRGGVEICFLDASLTAPVELLAPAHIRLPVDMSVMHDVEILGDRAVPALLVCLRQRRLSPLVAALSAGYLCRASLESGGELAEQVREAIAAILLDEAAPDGEILTRQLLGTGGPDAAAWMLARFTGGTGSLLPSATKSMRAFVAAAGRRAPEAVDSIAFASARNHAVVMQQVAEALLTAGASTPLAAFGRSLLEATRSVPGAEPSRRALGAALVRRLRDGTLHRCVTAARVLVSVGIETVVAELGEGIDLAAELASRCIRGDSLELAEDAARFLVERGSELAPAVVLDVVSAWRRRDEQGDPRSAAHDLTGFILTTVPRLLPTIPDAAQEGGPDPRITPELQRSYADQLAREFVTLLSAYVDREGSLLPVVKADAVHLATVASTLERLTMAARVEDARATVAVTIAAGRLAHAPGAAIVTDALSTAVKRGPADLALAAADALAEYGWLDADGIVLLLLMNPRVTEDDYHRCELWNALLGTASDVREGLRRPVLLAACSPAALSTLAKHVSPPRIYERLLWAPARALAGSPADTNALERAQAANLVFSGIARRLRDVVGSVQFPSWAAKAVAQAASATPLVDAGVEACFLDESLAAPAALLEGARDPDTRLALRDALRERLDRLGPVLLECARRYPLSPFAIHVAAEAFASQPEVAAALRDAFVSRLAQETDAAQHTQIAALLADPRTEPAAPVMAAWSALPLVHVLVREASKQQPERAAALAAIAARHPATAPAVTSSLRQRGGGPSLVVFAAALLRALWNEGGPALPRELASAVAERLRCGAPAERAAAATSLAALGAGALAAILGDDVDRAAEIAWFCLRAGEPIGALAAARLLTEARSDLAPTIARDVLLRGPGASRAQPPWERLGIDRAAVVALVRPILAGEPAGVTDATPDVEAARLVALLDEEVRRAGDLLPTTAKRSGL